jgi:hypothetical protein
MGENFLLGERAYGWDRERIDLSTAGVHSIHLSRAEGEAARRSLITEEAVEP